MTASQINMEAPALRTLADFGLVDVAKITTASYFVDAVAGRKVSYRENETVYFDDPDNQRRVVLRLVLETMKHRGKKIPVPESLPRFTVSTLKGYDQQKNMWGIGSHEENSVDLSLEEAAAFHRQFEEIRAGMVKEPHHWTWYRSDLARAS